MTYPEYIKKCIDLLEEKGFCAYVVGGAVRDGLLGRQAHDWDVTTSARPEQIMDVFSDLRTIPTGIKHGTVTVLVDGEEGNAVPVEITTFRIDGEYLDNRRPSEVIFAPSVLDDLSRRDFTVNAMAYNEKEGLVDCFSGREDLDLRLVRCVGEPSVRYTEDALRILRAYRFAAQLGFEIEGKTLEATATCAHLLKNIARERIGVEFLKLLASDGVLYALQELVDRGVFLALFDFVPTPDGQTLKKVAELDSGNAFTRLAALILPYDDEKRREFLNSLRLSNEQKKLTLRLCAATEFQISDDDEKALSHSARRFLADYKNICGSAIEMLFVSGKNDIKKLEKFAEAVRAEREKGNCLSIADLALDGKDVLAIAREPSQVGTILSALLAYVIEHPDKNKKNTLLQKAKEISDSM